jgi:hypothetical protein
MLYMSMNVEEVKPYFEIFDKTYWKQSGQPTFKQLDSMCQHGVKGGPRLYPPSVSVKDDGLALTSKY